MTSQTLTPTRARQLSAQLAVRRLLGDPGATRRSIPTELEPAVELVLQVVEKFGPALITDPTGGPWGLVGRLVYQDALKQQEDAWRADMTGLLEVLGFEALTSALMLCDEVRSGAQLVVTMGVARDTGRRSIYAGLEGPEDVALHWFWRQTSTPSADARAGSVEAPSRT